MNNRNSQFSFNGDDPLEVKAAYVVLSHYRPSTPHPNLFERFSFTASSKVQKRRPGQGRGSNPRFSSVRFDSAPSNTPTQSGEDTVTFWHAGAAHLIVDGENADENGVTAPLPGPLFITEGELANENARTISQWNTLPINGIEDLVEDADENAVAPSQPSPRFISVAHGEDTIEDADGNLVEAPQPDYQPIDLGEGFIQDANGNVVPAPYSGPQFVTYREAADDDSDTTYTPQPSPLHTIYSEDEDEVMGETNNSNKRWRGSDGSYTIRRNSEGDGYNSGPSNGDGVDEANGNANGNARVNNGAGGATQSPQLNRAGRTASARQQPAHVIGPNGHPRLVSNPPRVGGANDYTMMGHLPPPPPYTSPQYRRITDGQDRRINDAYRNINESYRNRNEPSWNSINPNANPNANGNGNGNGNCNTSNAGNAGNAHTNRDPSVSPPHASARPAPAHNEEDPSTAFTIDVNSEIRLRGSNSYIGVAPVNAARLTTDIVSVLAGSHNVQYHGAGNAERAYAAGNIRHRPGGGAGAGGGYRVNINSSINVQGNGNVIGERGQLPEWVFNQGGGFAAGFAQGPGMQPGFGVPGHQQQGQGHGMQGQGQGVNVQGQQGMRGGFEQRGVYQHQHQQAARGASSSATTVAGVAAAANAPGGVGGNGYRVVPVQRPGVGHSTQLTEQERNQLRILDANAQAQVEELRKMREKAKAAENGKKGGSRGDDHDMEDE